MSEVRYSGLLVVVDVDTVSLFLATSPVMLSAYVSDEGPLLPCWLLADDVSRAVEEVISMGLGRS